MPKDRKQDKDVVDAARRAAGRGGVRWVFPSRLPSRFGGAGLQVRL